MKVEPILVWDRVERSTARLRREAANARQVPQFRKAEHLMVAGELAFYELFACVFATSALHAASSNRHFIGGGLFRRALRGLAMGATGVVFILTPSVRRSADAVSCERLSVSFGVHAVARESKISQ